MEGYLTTLYEIVTRGQKTNSYKFALWRALARLAPRTDPQRPVITKADLAPLFVEYYWDLETKYHVRQGIDPDKDPIVMVLIRQLAKTGTIKSGEGLGDFQKRKQQEYNKLVDAVAREVFGDVIPRFHIVHGAETPSRLFSFLGTIGRAGNQIELTDAGRQFLIEHQRLVDYVAVAGWVRFTEQFTSAPRLFDKISGHKVQRGAVSRWRDSLAEFQDGRCFYNTQHDMGQPQVDHVLPWSFVLEDKTWNLVLSCAKCNNDKRDKLTTVGDLARLCGRNEKIIKDTVHTGGAFFRHFAEWRSRDLSAYVKGLYDQAVADNFPVWKSEDFSISNSPASNPIPV